MVNKCAVFGSKRGYKSEEPQHEDYHAFYFPLDEKKSHMLPAREKFVCRDGWKPSANSVICEFHLIKNVRNNLLNSRRFVFPQFDYEKDGIEIHCPAGYLAWSDLYQIFEHDVKLQSNLKKAHKLSYQVLHPGNKKQSVPLALAIFHETTTAALESCFPEREDASKFL